MVSFGASTGGRVGTASVAAGAVGTVVAFASLGELTGILVGLLLAGFAIVAPGVLWFVSVHLCAVALTTRIAPEQVALLEAGALSVLFGPMVASSPHSKGPLLALFGTGVVLGGVALLDRFALTARVAVVASVVAVVAYVIHRYELVRLGLVRADG